MNSAYSHLDFNEATLVNRCDRWEVYRRLQQLSIICHCQYGQPLRVYINDATTAIQFWSVVQQFNASRQERINWLSQCWKAS
jgi:hypothetical protein